MNVGDDNNGDGVEGENLDEGGDGVERENVDEDGDGNDRTLFPDVVTSRNCQTFFNITIFMITVE